MLGKLLKHEFRATAPIMLLLCGGLIGFSLLSVFFNWLDSVIGGMMTSYVLITVAYFLLALASVLIAYVLIIRRFWNSLFTDEGYLTLTLPVTRGKLLFSKLLVSVVWLIAVYLSLAVSVTFGFISKEFFKFLNDLLFTLYQLGGHMRELFGLSPVMVGVEAVILTVLSLLFSILSLYAAMAFGQLCKRHRVLGSFIGYFIIHTLMRIIYGCLSVVLNIGDILGDVSYVLVDGRLLNGIDTFNVQVDIWLFIIINAICVAGLALLTKLILERGLNMQ